MKSDKATKILCGSPQTIQIWWGSHCYSEQKVNKAVAPSHGKEEDIMSSRSDDGLSFL